MKTKLTAIVRLSMAEQVTRASYVGLADDNDSFTQGHHLTEPSTPASIVPTPTGTADEERQAVVRAQILPVFVPSLVQSIAMALVIPVLPLFARELGASDSMVGVSVAARGIGGVILAPYAGTVVAAAGVRMGSALGVLIMGISGIAAAMSPTMAPLLIARAADGFGLSLFQVGRATYLSKAVPASSRGSVSSLVAGMTRLGSTFGPAAGGALASMPGPDGAPIGFRLAFWAQAVVFGAATVLLLRFLDPGEEPRADPKPPEPKPSEPKPPEPKPSELKPPAAKATQKDDAEFVFPAQAQVLLVIVVALMVARSARETLLPLRGADLNIDASMIGYVTAASFTLDTALVPVAGYVMDRYGRKVACVPALVLLALGFVALCVLDGIVGVVVAALLLGFGNGLSNGWIQTVGTDLAPAGFRPQFLGYWSAGLNAGSAAGPLIVGVVAQHSGSTQTSSLVVCVCIAASALWYAMLGAETLEKDTATDGASGVETPKASATSKTAASVLALAGSTKSMV